MEKKNKKPIVFIVLLVSLFLVIGGTLAYYSTLDTYNNEFNTSEYAIETQEAFVSPDNWKPGDTTQETRDNAVKMYDGAIQMLMAVNTSAKVIPSSV